MELCFLTFQPELINDNSVLEVKLIEHEHNFVSQYNALLTNRNMDRGSDNEILEVNLSKRRRSSQFEYHQPKKQRL